MYRKGPKNLNTWKIAVIILKLESVVFPDTNMFKRCAWIDKQCRPRPDHSWRTCMSENIITLQIQKFVCVISAID